MIRFSDTEKLDGLWSFGYFDGEADDAAVLAAECREYETVRYGKKCPHCNSENTWLLQGNEVEIKEIEVI